MNKNACNISGNIDNVNDPVYNMKKYHKTNHSLRRTSH